MKADNSRLNKINKKKNQLLIKSTLYYIVIE